MSMWAKREALGNLYKVNAVNHGGNWNWGVLPGNQGNTKPAGIVTTQELMEHAIQNRFQKITRLANARHGAIYDVQGDMSTIETILSQDQHAFVPGYGYPHRLSSSARVLIKVTHMPGSSSLDWNSWLRYRVREAKMHTVVYQKLLRFSNCYFVPMLYFAGLDQTTGLYYVVMERPPGKLHSIASYIEKKTFGPRAYRSVEASIGRIWRIGAMLSDMSAGNIIMSSRGYASVVDFDSSIVFPAHIRTRMEEQLDALVRGKKMNACFHIQKSTQPDLPRAWNFVMREHGDTPSLKKLVADVYNRKTWYPDVTMLRRLFTVATQTRIPRKQRSFIFKTLKRRLRDDSETPRASLKIRRIVALPGVVKEIWKRRKHEHRRRHVRTVASVPAVRFRNIDNNNLNFTQRMRMGGGGVVVPSSMNVAARPNIQILNPNVTRLITPQGGSGAFSEGINTGKNTGANKNVKRVVSPPVNDEYLNYSSLNNTRKKEILEFEIDRVKTKTNIYNKFVESLLKKTEVLDKGIQTKFPKMRWSEMTPKDHDRLRSQYVDEIATDLLLKVLAASLERPVLTNSRNTYINTALQDVSKLSVLQRLYSTLTGYGGMRWFS